MNPLKPSLGISGRIAAFFQEASITPLLALVALLAGLFAVLVTPREEEPQINVTMANVLIPFPGASSKDVEQMVSVPAEQVLSQISGIEHVMSVSQTGLSILTVQFKVGVPRIEALVRLHDTVAANSDWLPPGLGALTPIIKPKGIDDVPIVSITLYAKTLSALTAKPADLETARLRLELAANRMESDVKRVAGTREVTTIGGPRRAIRVELDPDRLLAKGITPHDIHTTLSSVNAGSPAGELLVDDQSIMVESGPFFTSAKEVADVVVGVRMGFPVFLKDVATIEDGPIQPQRFVWHAARSSSNEALQTHPAVTLAVTKKPGENAIDVANQVAHRLTELKASVLGPDIDIQITRNYGQTANQKATQLIQKLLFATVSVVALVFIALGRREALIVGLAVVLTLAATLFASWAWGFTINRVSLFALIFSIGILVDDAIVVVENIHRHQKLFPEKSLTDIIPAAVDEVGGPTILATLTVIAALLPMAFVSGLMGPYMSPIPINASMGMLLSLAIAFVITPWMARRWMQSGHDAGPGRYEARIQHFFQSAFRPFLDDRQGASQRKKLALGVLAAIVLSVALPAVGWVVLKMLPFDNKSEFQVILDMPAGTRLEKTDRVLREMGEKLSTIPEVSHFQIYSGTAAPINFNGLVRQYAFRQEPWRGDIQVNLVDKDDRSAKSHVIALRVRPLLHEIAKAHGGNVKVVEVPPGPPVLAPIVAEVYGPTEEGRIKTAKDVRAVFESTSGMVDIDDSTVAQAPRKMLVINRQKASQMGVPQQAIVATLRMGLSGHESAYLHDASKYPVPVMIRLAESRQDNLDDLLKLSVRSVTRESVPLSRLVDVVDADREQIRYRKNLLPVTYVTADVAGGMDSPLYGLFKSRSGVQQIKDEQGRSIDEYFISAPSDPYQAYAIKWDGESQVTYETFRDMGAAYAVGLVLIYLLVVAQFGSYLMPLIIMAPIPLTIIGVMPGHALLGAQFTATSMIGMIALAGIIVRNSILLVDFILLQVKEGMPLKDAVIQSAIARAQPIVLTGLAAMLGAFFILDDPIFNGLAISLIFGILISTLLTLVVIPLLVFSFYRRRFPTVST